MNLVIPKTRYFEYTHKDLYSEIKRFWFWLGLGFGRGLELGLGIINLMLYQEKMANDNRNCPICVFLVGIVCSQVRFIPS